MTDFPDWAAPQANATAIAGTGVPLLTGAGLLGQGTQVIPASSSVQLLAVNISQIGYELLLNCFINSASTNPFVSVLIEWIDSASGSVVATDSYMAVCSNSSLKPFPTIARGPTKADMVQVSASNTDTVNSASVAFLMLQHSRLLPRDDFFWANQYPVGNTVPGFTLPILPPDESVLGIISGTSVPGSGSITRLMGMYNGPIGVGINMNTGNLSAMGLFLAPQPTSVYGGNNPIFGGVPPAAAFTVAGPRSPIRLIINNLTTTAIVLTMSLIRAQ